MDAKRCHRIGWAEPRTTGPPSCSGRWLRGVYTGYPVAVSKVGSDDGEQVFLFVETTTDTPINPELAELCKQTVVRDTGVSCDFGRFT